MKKLTALLIAIILLLTFVQLPTAVFAAGGDSPTVSEGEPPADPAEPTEPTEPTEPQEPEVIAPTRLAFQKTEIILPVGGKATLQLRVTPKNAVLDGAYQSSRPAVATVSNAGKITAVAKGKTTVSYTAQNGVKATCRVIVKNVTKTVKLNETNVNLLFDKDINKGFTFRIKYTLDKGAYDKVVFRSADESVATVSAKGLVTPQKPGKVKIIVKAAGGAKARCTVHVNDNGNTWTSLNQLANRYAIQKKCVTRYIYGHTVLGRPMEAYIIRGENSKKSNVLFIDFACHGFEDEYYRDGKVLAYVGNRIVSYYAKHPDALGEYTLVAVPCANPDGTIAGHNNQRACSTAFGRCTAAHVDMNRDFGAFRGKESRAQKALFRKFPPDIYLNFHGWLNTSIGTPWLARRSSNMLGFDRVQAGSYGQGYIINYVRKKYGAAVCLVEYRSPASARKSVGKTRRFLDSLM